MKFRFLLLLSFTLSTFVFGQTFTEIGLTNLKEIQPAEEYENVYSKVLYENEEASYFLIWIKKGVKSHKHVEHAENLQIIEGSGIMTVGEHSFEVKKGDFFIAPKNTFHSLIVTSETPMKVLSIQMPNFDGSDRVFEED